MSNRSLKRLCQPGVSHERTLVCFNTPFGLCVASGRRAISLSSSCRDFGWERMDVKTNEISLGKRCSQVAVAP